MDNTFWLVALLGLVNIAFLTYITAMIGVLQDVLLAKGGDQE